ncbi:MAG: hypothetical protein RIT24_1833, partial [Planctomycetota bacterium]
MPCTAVRETANPWHPFAHRTESSDSGSGA